MPLLFLITYVILTYFIYKKNKDNVKIIPLVVKLNGIIGFALLFVYIAYYYGGNFNDLDKKMYAYSFYFLLFSYIIIFIYHTLNYRLIFINNKKEIKENRGKIERIIDNFYFLIIFILSFIFLIYSNPINLKLEIFIYILLLLSSIYIFLEKKIFSN